MKAPFLSVEVSHWSWNDGFVGWINTELVRVLVSIGRHPTKRSEAILRNGNSARKAPKEDLEEKEYLEISGYFIVCLNTELQPRNWNPEIFSAVTCFHVSECGWTRGAWEWRAPGPVSRKSPKLFGRISGVIILFVSSKRRRLEARNFAVILIFSPFTTYEKNSCTK